MDLNARTPQLLTAEATVGVVSGGLPIRKLPDSRYPSLTTLKIRRDTR